MNRPAKAKKQPSASTKRAKKAPPHTLRSALARLPAFVHGAVASASIGFLTMLALQGIAQANAISLSSPRDCDTNAVMNCGALSTAEIQKKYSNNGVAAIYSYFQISATDIRDISKYAVAGAVHKNGTITVAGKTVATGALTAGRENIKGSLRVVSGGTTFYRRPPSVSFVPNSLAAFVVMKDGRFDYAILGACGNPVSGTPTAKPTPAPPMAPVAPPTPPPTTPATPVTPTAPDTPVTPITPTTPPASPTTPPTTPETPTVPDTPAVSTQTPPSTQTPSITTTAAAVTSLPKTGPGDVAIIGVLAVAGGYLSHVTHRHMRQRWRARRLA